ncbi:MAG: DUF368 domain-containing protein [Phycisphaerales bacterium]|nr:DUF368 domain-containing protein [Phycisphaerales bacterium]
MTPDRPDPTPAADAPIGRVVARGGIGGVLMGLANLVPGISGGTMLLASGIYPAFIGGVAELFTFRFRLRSVVLVGTVVLAAGLSIVTLAATFKSLVVEHQWVMYSLFIGLTLGGVPLIHKRLRPIRVAGIVGAVVGAAVMVGLAIVQTAGAGTGGGGAAAGTVMLVVAGAAAGAAMILPGVSGSYLLLILGQYVVILGAIDAFKQGLIAGDGAAIMGALGTCVPFGLGVVTGVVGVSVIMKFCLRRYPQATLGVLLGLLIGAVAGLWPFRAPVRPEIGQPVKGVILRTEADVDAVKMEDWPTAVFAPSGLQIASALGLVGLGLATSIGIGLLDRSPTVRTD